MPLEIQINVESPSASATPGQPSAGGGLLCLPVASSQPLLSPVLGAVDRTSDRTWRACPSCGNPFSARTFPRHAKLCRELHIAAGAMDPSLEVIRAKFLEWDADNSGSISEQEMVEVMSRVCPSMKVEDIQELFDVADSNQDGVVDYQEFVNFLAPAHLKPTKMSDDDLEALRCIFNFFDGDGNGLLETREFEDMTNNVLASHAFDMSAADTNSDGQIDFDEFVHFWSSIVGNPGFNTLDVQEAIDMFKCFDFDSSGSIDEDELLCLLDNLFPDRCEENEAIVDSRLKHRELQSSRCMTLAKFLDLYDSLVITYGERKWPPADAERRQGILAAGLVQSHCGLRFFPDRLGVHERNCEECRDPVARARLVKYAMENVQNKHKQAEVQATLAEKYSDEDSRNAQQKQSAIDDLTSHISMQQEKEDEEWRRNTEEGKKKEDARRAEEQRLQQLRQVALEELRHEAETRAAEKVRREEEDAIQARTAAETKEINRLDFAASVEVSKAAIDLAERKAKQKKAAKRAMRLDQKTKEVVEEPPKEFLPCDWCGHLFFPDRMPEHLAFCKQKPRTPLNP